MLPATFSLSPTSYSINPNIPIVVFMGIGIFALFIVESYRHGEKQFARKVRALAPDMDAVLQYCDERDPMDDCERAGIYNTRTGEGWLYNSRE